MTHRQRDFAASPGLGAQRRNKIAVIRKGGTIVTGMYAGRVKRVLYLYDPVRNMVRDVFVSKTDHLTRLPIE